MITTKMGIQITFVTPKNMIMKPPTDVSPNSKVNDFLIPSFSYINPPANTAISAVLVLAKVLL